jgi:hypothetical protein
MALSGAMLAGLLLAACDPVEVVYLEHPDGAPVLCPEGAETEFAYVFPVVDHDDPTRVLYEVRDSATVDASGNPFSTDPDRVAVGLVGGSIEGGVVPWLQFTVTCGDDAAPWLVTPRIRREDLEKVDGDFRYVVE